jgi:tartrate-resistant acid phosphatase type 5
MSDISFVCFGDWGSGKPEQINVAKALANYYQDTKFQFVCGLGDNIYPAGINSFNYRELIFTLFTEMYRPIQVPFYMILGNHDHMGDPLLQCQLSGLDHRWYLPTPYYEFRISSPNKCNLHFIALDSESLQQKTKESEEQYQWIESQLQRTQNQVHWTIIMAHHPIVSSGCHGDANKYYLERLTKLLTKFPVDIIMSGHDHDKQITKLSSGATQLIAGTAGFIRYCHRSVDRTQSSSFVAETLGFCSVDVTKYIVELKMWTPSMSAHPSGNGKYELEYTYMIEPRSTYITKSN